jgi:acyl-homoserine lactone synthase
MIEAHVVTASNIHLYEAEFDEFLQRRHDVFVQAKGWRPPSPDGRERDEFDTADATYILGLEDGRVLTSARLIPTHLPHLVSEVFPQLCERNGVPRRPDWAEWTRTFVLQRERHLGLRGTFTQLCCAVMEFAVEEGLSAVGGVQETYAMPRLGRFGWKLLPQGLAREMNGETYIVCYIEAGEEALASIRRVLGIDRPLLVRRGAQRPFVPVRPEVLV